jgi:hypothetical protein
MNISKYQSIRPLLTKDQGGLLLGVGGGGRGVTYRTFSSPKNRSVSGEVDSAGTFPVFAKK